MRGLLALAVGALAVVGAGRAAAAALDIQTWTTANGARVLFVPAPEIPMIDVRVVFAAGSARDGSAAGVANLTNVLLTEGAGARDADAWSAALGATGAKLQTGAERDMAHATLRTLSEARHAEPALALLVDALAAPRFDPAAVERAKARILIGLKHKQQSPEDLAEDTFYARVYAKHPYASPPDGTEASVAALGRALARIVDEHRAHPALHRQPRMGEGGREFELIKLRTMRVHHEGPAWTSEGDARISRVGRVLRRFHIDELPQLWLVLKGEMSLVGPRPEQPDIVTQLEARFSYYDRRHLVKPGITGWAQVRCGYSGSHIGSAWKLCHDLYYLKRRSLFFDLLIMLETISTVEVPEPMKRPDDRFIVAARAGEEVEAGLESA